MPDDSAASVAGVVLAAGTSTRFGRNKLLLVLDGESLARRAARTAIAAELDPVIVVLGHEAERVREEISDLPVRTIVNSDYARGINTSLAAGVAAVPAEAEAVVVLLADMPHVTAGMVSRVVQAFRDTLAPIIASRYEGAQAPPTLYARSLFGELGGSEGEGSGKSVVRRHASELVAIDWPKRALADVDREEDWDRLLATF
jgi:molybdenum cofactor cytidylyltransferase